MAINFPNSPSVNDIHVSGANRWQWNGSSWTRIGGVNSDADVINSSNDNSTTTLYPVMVTGTGAQNAKIATSATKNLKFDASEGDLTVGGNISVGGTITYEDVTNVDSIGVVTARAGVKVTGGDISVGTAATICSAGNMSIDKPGAGIITATRFVGSGVSLTDVISGVGIRTAGGTVGWAATIIDFRGPGVTTAYYSSVTGVGTVYFQGGGGGASVSISENAPSSPGAGDLWWDSDVGNLQIYYTDANSSQWVTANNSGPQGPQGAQGATGAQGHQGVQGAQGHQGVQGAAGAQGAQGHQGHQGVQGSVGIASLTISTGAPSSPAQGDMWWDSDDANLSIYYNDGNSSQWVNINAGPAGAQGAQGAQGATGAQGHQGVQGATGSTGAAGAQGAQGHQGHQGVQGTAGASITINNNASTRFITATGSATSLDGEPNLTYNNSLVTFGSSNLLVNKSSSPTISAQETTGNKETQLRTNTTGGLLRTLGNYPLVFGTNQTERARLTNTRFLVGTSDDSGYDNRSAYFHNGNHGDAWNYVSVTGGSGGGAGFVFGDGTGQDGSNYESYMYHDNTNNNFYLRTDRGNKTFTFDNNGDLNISDGDLVIGTAGHGVNFSATSNSSGSMWSETLSDYEHGEWTPTTHGWSTATPYAGSSYRHGWYVKVGAIVTVGWKIYYNTLSGSYSHIGIGGFPYASAGNHNAIAPARFDVPETAVTYDLIYYMGAGGTSVWLYQKNSSGGISAINASGNRSNCWTFGTVTYYAG